MKKFISLGLVLVMAYSMSIIAFAESVSEPSVEIPTVPEAFLVDAEGNVVENDVLNNIPDAISILFMSNEADFENAPQKTKDALNEAYTAIEESASIEELIPEFAGFELVDSPFALSVSNEVEEVLARGGYLYITLPYLGSFDDGTVLGLMIFIDGQWVCCEDCHATILEDGCVRMSINQPGVFALLSSKSSTETINEVTVPTSLPITVDANGNVITASDAFITNNGNTSAKISSIVVSPANGWSLVSASDANSAANGEKKISLSFNGKSCNTNGVVDTSSFGIISAGKSMNLKYNAVIPGSINADSGNAATAVIVIKFISSGVSSTAFSLDFNSASGEIGGFQIDE